MDKAAIELFELQNEVLELVVTGTPFAQVADRLCRRAEALAPGVVCTLVKVDKQGLIRPVAAPSLPAEYGELVDGEKIGPEAGSCGTAAYFRQPVVVTDIATDPRWKGYKDAVLPLGLAACWSSPILDEKGQPLASFAFYYREKRGPDEMERQLVAKCVHLCTLALERAEFHDRLQRLAYVDQLTGLPNRFAFDERLEKESQTEAGRLSLLMVDIDNLKMVNDSMGHLTGDMLIKQVAARIGAAAGGMPVYRLGGDEFAVLCTDCTSERALTSLAETVLTAMRPAFDAGGNSVVPLVTIGGALWPDEGASAARLQQNADLALYHAKETRRGRFVLFSAGYRTSIERRNDQISRLEAALKEGRVKAHFQPVVNLGDARIVGLEALARIITPDGQIISAQEFHQALSDPKNTQLLTDCMLEQVASAAGEWISEGMGLEHIALNLSSADFQRSNLCDQIIDAFGRHGVPLDRVQIEVTELVLMNRGVAQVVSQLRSQGIQVALDDFGTGYASLSHLRDLPVDFIKIDKSFVENFIVDWPSRVIVEALIDVARKLDMKLIAEGVETEAQADLLRACGCMLGQGYHFARPADALATGDLLRLVYPTSTERKQAI